ncbi:hypothetical protein ElyMa_006853200 [Elysia marginata]|uniref:Uncharacterized protein n=1 Tax=Elysia marginata TaxID=1093978 RepID=A0AAV4J765_9GAST|nr:hypothetical protein ElyMa_006853200 [Elysia marginata]
MHSLIRISRPIKRDKLDTGLCYVWLRARHSSLCAGQSRGRQSSIFNFRPLQLSKIRLSPWLGGDESSYEPPGTYYGSTLTSQLGGAKPTRSSIRSLECSRLRVRSAKVLDSILDKSANTSRPTSAQSRGTTVKSRGTSVKSIAFSTRSDVISVPSRATTARNRQVTSAKSQATSIADGFESSARSSMLCTSSMNRPMTSVAISRASSSGGRRSLRSRKRSPSSAASTGFTSEVENGTYTNLGLFHPGLSVWFLEVTL